MTAMMMSTIMMITMIMMTMKTTAILISMYSKARSYVKLPFKLMVKY